jgi:hypothetical protein
VGWFGVCCCAQTRTQDPAAETVEAIFIGYQQDDLIFHIVNRTSEPIWLKGLTFNRQTLYRPVEKNALVPVATNEVPFTVMLFRTTGDFVWSQNHMDRFRMAYMVPGSAQKYYVAIFPAGDPSENEKEVASEGPP